MKNAMEYVSDIIHLLVSYRNNLKLYPNLREDTWIIKKSLSSVFIIRVIYRFNQMTGLYQIKCLTYRFVFVKY